jgi:hypothetical protein
MGMIKRSKKKEVLIKIFKICKKRDDFVFDYYGKPI